MRLIRDLTDVRIAMISRTAAAVIEAIEDREHSERFLRKKGAKYRSFLPPVFYNKQVYNK